MEHTKVAHELGVSLREEREMKEARHPNSQRFHDIMKELGDLHDKKQADYGRGDDPFANVRGSVEWGIPPWVGAMVRATDKVKRLQNFARKGELQNESVIDAFMDLAVYAIIAMVLYEEES
jgi:hypothetical protein